ncbi:unnamed protein product [Rotaria magnacalcarata]|uniref:EB domain-containing protein n=1 Tax=Rotaria magnacalcarata TaxID=392030 RepID=A0A819G9R7_9BILA|nr:unnamed protein product [Rotaria magnacalcarata]CAF2116067.1 unnamed protein product [Rotaria magnacalcarata]CAF3878640.1 unnamed protein product [Rotaria magnacalcarata]CAF3905970.1 unnamed protein product [Rotaria magnacalcarata]
MAIDNRTLSMIVPYLLDNQEEESLFVKILTRTQSHKPLISFNLNLIQCSNNEFLNWTSVESSLTLRGEFVRTTFADANKIYLSSGVTYLKNLTMLDCSIKTTYRTNDDELFQIKLKIESTLNDYCSSEHLCYPENVYQCDFEQHRCTCRSSYQSYLNKYQQSICVHAVENISQCTMNDIHCIEWCHEKRSSTTCTCPKDLSSKKLSDDDRAYCEGRINGPCNSFIQCPLGDICVQGTCQNTYYKLHYILSFDIATVSIIASCLILLVIIIILGISICILRRQRWKKHYDSSIDTVYKRKQQTDIPATSNYDNIIYGVFHNNVQLSSTVLSSNDDNVNDSSPFTASSDSTSYNPKVVFLGGDQHLTAIYA